VLRAAGDHNLVGRVAQVVLAFELLGDGFAQGQDARGGGVFGVACVDGFQRARFGEVGRVEVGFACRETQHIDALPSQFLGARGQRQGRRRLRRQRPL
jgi:hypothetical protein